MYVAYYKEVKYTVKAMVKKVQLYIHKYKYNVHALLLHECLIRNVSVKYKIKQIQNKLSRMGTLLHFRE